MYGSFNVILVVCALNKFVLSFLINTNRSREKVSKCSIINKNGLEKLYVAVSYGSENLDFPFLLHSYYVLQGL